MRLQSGHISDIIGVSQKTLQGWDDAGVVVPSEQSAEGTGSQRIYTLPDVVAARVAQLGRGFGLRLSQLEPIVRVVRAAVEEGSADAVVVSIDGSIARVDAESVYEAVTQAGGGALVLVPRRLSDEWQSRAAAYCLNPRRRPRGRPRSKPGAGGRKKTTKNKASEHTPHDAPEGPGPQRGTMKKKAKAVEATRASRKNTIREKTQKKRKKNDT